MIKTTWRKIVQITVLAAISTGLYANDGVVLIDQRIAMSGKVSPGDTPGFPVTISQAGTYRLVGNITVPDLMTTAVHITADFVTLDLNGFSIIGPNVCTPNPTTCTFSGGGVGVHAGDFLIGTVPSRGVRVLNGTVRGMGFHGVRMLGDGAVVERVHTHGNGGPGIFVGGSVIDSVSSQNGGVGIGGVIVRGSTSMDNRTIGIFITGNGGVAAGNAIHSNGGNGITASAGSTVTGNITNNNKGFGISTQCPSSIVGNAAIGNQLGSIQPLGVCTLVNNAP